MDGAQPVGDGGEAVEVVVKVVVEDGITKLGRDKVSTLVAVTVGARGTVFFVVAAAVLLLSGVTITVSVVDAGMQTLAVKVVSEIGLVGLLVASVEASRVEGTRLHPISRVLLSHMLVLSCCDMETSTSFFDFMGVGKRLEYLEYGGHVGRWRGEDIMAVVLQHELILQVPGPDG